jgi:phosphoglycolate phosphatase
MPYKLVLFDFDGTLADSFPWFLELANKAAAQYRFGRIEEADRERLRGYEARQVMAHLGMAPWKAPLVARFMRRQMAQEIDRISLFPGVDLMLEGLFRKGVTIAVVSSNSEENIRRMLGARLSAFIRYYEGGISMFGKRHKLRKVLAASGVQPAEALAVGDEIRDLEAARAAGIPFGAVAWGYTRLEALVACSPEEVFTRVEEIVERSTLWA